MQPKRFLMGECKAHAASTAVASNGSLDPRLVGCGLLYLDREVLRIRTVLCVPQSCSIQARTPTRPFPRLLIPAPGRDLEHSQHQRSWMLVVGGTGGT